MFLCRMINGGTSMQSIILSTVFLVPCVCIIYGQDYSYSSTRQIRNKRSVRQIAFHRACLKHTCQNHRCNNEDGWNLYGSDWGCCGNYDGCCTWASPVCYYHDVLCKCCEYSWLVCGPGCKKEAECFENYEENTNKVFDQYEAKENKTDDEDRKLVSLNSQGINKPLNDTQENDILRGNKQVQEEHLEVIKHKKYIKRKKIIFKKKISKIMNMLPSDELLMADQARNNNEDELGSGDELG